MDFNDLRIHVKDLDLLKAFFLVTSRSFVDGACFLISDLDKVTYKSADRFDIPGTNPGTPNRKGTITDAVIEARKMVVRNMDAGIYGLGLRIRALAIPVWNDDDTEVIGTVGLAVPRQHKLIHAFDTFAPLLGDLLPEGGFFCVTDKEKCVKRQGSKKFDMEKVQPGTANREGSVSMEVIKTKKLVVQEIDASLYGFPVMSAAAPLTDEESGDIVGTFVLVLPRKLAHNLKGIAVSLDEGLAGVATAMQQITSSTNEVSGSQSRLNEEIENVKSQLEKINHVMAFTKDIADETKMLGLNAAIEAARVGDAGRGFGVVAEEIRKLSEESKRTVTQIKELTSEIERTMNETSTASHSTLAVVSDTSAAIEEVNATIEEITSLASQLADTAAAL